MKLVSCAFFDQIGPKCLHPKVLVLKRRALLSALAWGLQWGPGLHAQLKEDANKTGTNLNTVEVVGHFDTRVGISDSASEGVVLGQTLQDQAFLRPGEVMETVPGLVVTQHSGDGKANQYFLRGYNLDHGTDFSTSIDGVQANMPTHAHGQGYADLNHLIPEIIDHIDYRKGTYFPENGDFSSAGSADVVYQKSLDKNLFNYTLGAYGYQRVLLAGSTQLSPHSALAWDPTLIDAAPTLLGALELVHENGPWVVAEKLQKINGLLRLSDGSRARGWSGDLSYYTSHWNATDQVPLELVQSGQLNPYGSLNPTDGGNAGRMIVSGETHDATEDGFVKISASLQHQRLQLWSDFTLFEWRPQSGDQFEQAENRDILTTKWVRGWNHALLGRDSVTELGGALRYDDILLGLYNTQSRAVLATVSKDRVHELMQSVWLKNTTPWNDHWRTIVGVRGDHLNLQMNAWQNSANSGQAQAGVLSPKMSTIFGPWQKTEFFFNAGRGFHSNDARGVLDQIDPTTGMPATPVPALASSFGEEIGLRTEIIPHWQSSLALWKLQSGSEIVFSADSGIGSTSPNGASQRSGLEWNNHFIANDGIFVDADLAWTHARYANMNDNGQAGNQIPNAVGKVGVLRAALHQWGPWSLGWETRYIGAYPLTQDGSQVAPAALVSNLRVKREINRETHLTLDLLNVFNRAYYDIAYNQDYQITPTSALQPSAVTVHPGEPRQLRIGLQVRF